MEVTLEKIELVRDKTGVTYKEAKEALEKADGDVLEALIVIEEEMNGKESVDEGFISGVVERIKDLIKRGNVSKILIKKNGETLVNIPVNVGIVGAVLAPTAVVATTIAAFGLKCKVEVITNDGQVVDVTSRATDIYQNTLEKGAAAFEYAKENIPEAFGRAKESTENAWNFAKEKTEDAWETVKEKTGDALETCKEKVSGDKK